MVGCHSMSVFSLESILFWMLEALSERFAFLEVTVQELTPLLSGSVVSRVCDLYQGRM